MNNPDKFAWQNLFVKVNLPSGVGQNATWETWATDEETFPPNPDPNKPPTWPAGSSRPKRLRRVVQLEILEQQRLHDLQDEARIFNVQPLQVPIAPEGASEEVRRNKATFDFIVANNLWYQQGLVTALQQNKKIRFTIESVEIKANWKPISDAQKPQYHWNTDSTGKVFGLIAMHIISKDVPNWVWATFEQVDNPDRCKVLGCRDTFGLTADGKVSPQLIALFKQNGLGQEWLNYRLDGVQLDFTDSTGVPTLLGNSITEDGFVSSSSCITCHARSTVNATGGHLSVFAPGQQSYNGPPDPKWFYTSAIPPKPVYLQLDFIWGFLAARPAKTGSQ